MRGIAVGVKAELNYFHTREIGILKQFYNIIAEYAEILGNNRSVGIFLKNLVEKLHSRSFCPLAYPCRFTLGGNLPKAGEGSEMVNSNYVIGAYRRPYSVEPPIVAVLFHRFPVIEGITPKLTVL